MSTYELKKKKQTFTPRVDCEASEDNSGKTVLTDLRRLETFIFTSDVLTCDACGLRCSTVKKLTLRKPLAFQTEFVIGSSNNR